jgi:innexin
VLFYLINLKQEHKMDILALSRRIPFLGLLGNSAVDDDFSDRLNYKYTVGILVMFGFVVTNKHFGHKQIQCWVPAYFTKNFEDYTNLICWITNTYYIPHDKELNFNNNTKSSLKELRYYQWVPYILLLLAFCFYIPRLVWTSVSVRCGIDVKDLVEAAHDYKSVDKIEKSGRMMEYVIGSLDSYLDDSHLTKSKSRITSLLSNHLVITYIFTKVLYIINCYFQLFLISVLLGRDFYSYGLNVLTDIINGKGYLDSVYFPRITQCKFNIRELGLKNFSHEYNVQCVLPINLFNQQIFTFLWFWYFFLFIANSLSLCIWFCKFLPFNCYKYAVKKLNLLSFNCKVSNSTQETIDFSLNTYPAPFDSQFKRVLFSPINLYKSHLNDKNYAIFIHSYLKLDGIFILNMIACSSNDYVSTQVMHFLWKNFIDKYSSNNSMKLEENSVIYTESNRFSRHDA